MPFKYDDNGDLVTTIPDGASQPLPVQIDSDGNEIAYDPDVPATKLKQARDDKKTLSSRLADAEERLAKYSGIEDPETLVAEVEELRKLAKAAKKKGANDDPDSGGSEEVNRLSQQLDGLNQQIESLNAALEKANGEIESRDSRINQLSVGSQFSSSAWFNPWLDEEGSRRSAKTLLDPEAAQALFGGHFSPSDNGQSDVVAYWTKGGKDIIYSKKEPDKPASFDEAFGLLYSKWDKKNHYSPSDAPGGMNSRESGGGVSGSRLSPSQVESMDQAEYEKRRSEGWSPDSR